jgi:sortase A
VSRAGDVVRTGLRGLGQTLITLGVVVLLFCVYSLYVTNLYTAQEQGRLDDRLTESWAAAPASTATAPVPVAIGQPWGALRIPALGEDYRKVVVEGVGVEELKSGPGHYPGTAEAGQVGNVVVSGHRTTYGAPFERFGELTAGMPVVVETRDTWFTYRILRTEIVAPTAVEVTYAVPGDAAAVPTRRLLTLTTCHPKYSAKQRLIVTAELESTMAKADGLPPVLSGQA